MMTVDERYAHFFTLHPSHRPSTAMRLNGCRLLDRLVRERQPKMVLDLGSGITSHILRALVSEFPEMNVVTTDTSIEYLQITVDELQNEGLYHLGCLSQNAFELTIKTNPEWAGATFDLICVDLGNLDFRVDRAELFASWLSPNGIMVLDDFGMRDYAERMTQRLEHAGLKVSADPSTVDEYGTYLALAERVA